MVEITLFEPRDCFFCDGSNWCAGWAIGETELPIVPKYASLFYLVRDATGECRWLQSSKVAFRGNNYRFDTYAGNAFDWSKINRLPLIPNIGN